MTQISPVLVADDNHDDVRLLEFAWSNVKCAAPLQVVHDGEEAVAYLSATGAYSERQRFPLPSLLILDLKMPRKDGFEVLDWVRGASTIKRLPVVILTASLHKSDVDRAYELGANAFLVKPVELQKLIAMVKAIEAFWIGQNRPPTLAA